MRPAVPSPAVESARVACTCAWRRPRGNQAHSKKILLFQDLLIKVLQTLHVIMLSSPAKPAGTSTISEADLPLQTIAAHLESFWGSPTIRKKHCWGKTFLCSPLPLELGVLVYGMRGIWKSSTPATSSLNLPLLDNSSSSFMSSSPPLSNGATEIALFFSLVKRILRLHAAVMLRT